MSERWRDTKVTVPCDGDSVLGYWSEATNFGRVHIGMVRYSQKAWHAWHEPLHKCGAPDFWMPISLPQPQLPEEK